MPVVIIPVMAFFFLSNLGQKRLDVGDDDTQCRLLDGLMTVPVIVPITMPVAQITQKTPQ